MCEVTEQVRKSDPAVFDGPAAPSGYNAVNVNVYERDVAALARHRDDEPIFVCETVASVSFGAARRFRIWHPEGGLAFDGELCHGDLLCFPRMWEHEVLPPTKLQLQTQRDPSNTMGMVRVNHVSVCVTLRRSAHIQRVY